MKKICALFSLITVIAISVCSCSNHSEAVDSQNLAVLESQLSVLCAAESADASSIESLIEEIERLKKNTIANEPSTATQISTEGTKAVGFTYTLDGSNATVTGYVGNEKNIIIPASIDGYKIVSIADRAFADTFIESVIISESVTSIGWFAFDGCIKLKSITVPSSVTSIGYAAFGNAESPVTVYCHSDSFALKYAKSYGLSYTVI